MRSLRLTYDFENEFAALRRSRSDAESIFDKLRGFVDIVFTSVIQAAENTAGVDLLTHLDFEDDADGGVDGILFGIAAGAEFQPEPAARRGTALFRFFADDAG